MILVVLRLPSNVMWIVGLLLRFAGCLFVYLIIWWVGFIDGAVYCEYNIM